MTPISRRALILGTPALLLPGAALGALVRTPGSTEGPFYPTRLPADRDSDLVRVEGAVREAGGDILHLDGAVLDRNGRAVSGARVEIWQCDANGIYLHPGDRRQDARDAAFQGFGHATTDESGRFAFRTIVPVPYTGRTPHIHVKVLSRGRDVLTTQLYRAGFPQNADDFLFRQLGEAERALCSMTLAPVGGAPRPTFRTAVRLVL